MRVRQAIALILVLATSATGCSGGDEERSGASGGTLVFAQLFEPNTLDPAFESHVVQFVLAAPIFETLVRVRPGGTEIVPGLARSWQPGQDGRSWTFQLQPDVLFHDGTPFNAAAVCFNFERWYHFTGVAQALSRLWAQVMGGYAGSGSSLYRSCEVRSDFEVTINLTRPDGTFIPSMAVPAFAVASPDALRRFEADMVSGGPDQPRFEGTFGTEHPTGTGPFRFESWTRNDKLVLVRNPDYWSTKPDLERVIIRRIDDGAARRQAFESGELDGYLPVDPPDVDVLRKFGANVFETQALGGGHLAMNNAKAPLDDVTVRRAIAHAINIPQLLKAKYPASAEAPQQLVPPGLWGRATNPPAYPYDPARARQLLAEARPADLTLDFAYPTTSIGPDIPEPEAVFLAMKADLEAVGFTVVGRPIGTLREYFRLDPSTVDLWFENNYAFLTDPDAILAVLRERRQEYGFNHPEFFSLLEQARGEIDQAKRAPMYERASRIVMEQLPVLPYVHVKPAMVFSRKVTGYVPGYIPWDGITSVRMR